jgi:hypothetical protein
MECETVIVLLQKRGTNTPCTQTHFLVDAIAPNSTTNIRINVLPHSPDYREQL